MPQSGIGRFEYINGTMYSGNWKLHNGAKVKHGFGKITFSGTTASEFGNEEYEGDWEEDLMHGYGTYKYTSGAVYTGQWHKGKQHGTGQMQYADGSRYEGQWENNLMHGDGVYTDSDQVRWEGIFVQGTFESKIQKKLQGDKLLKEKRKLYEEKAKEFFVRFLEAFAKSDKKTFKDNLAPFFATAEHVQEYVSDPYPKFEEKQPDKWNEWMKIIYSDGKCKIKALGSKEEATLIPQTNVHCEQLREKPGGQLVEVTTQVADKNFVSVLCELPNENWVMVYYAEKAI